MLHRIAVLTIAAGLAVADARAEDRSVFKWVDAEGKVIYSDRPRGDDAQQMNIRSRATDNAAITAARQARIETAQAERLKELEGAQVAESEDEEAARYAENCRRAQQALESLQQANRLYLPTEDGGRRYLTEEETELRLAKARTDVSDWCR